MKSKDENRNLSNQEYNILSFFSGHENERSRIRQALEIFGRLVDRGYAKDTAIIVIKKVFLMDISKFVG